MKIELKITLFDDNTVLDEISLVRLIFIIKRISTGG